MKTPQRRRRIWRIVSGSMVLLLAAAVFVVGEFHVPFYPQDSFEQVIFFALICLIVGTFGIFVMILTRTLLRLGAERGGGALGARFKTKMVLGATGISLLPIIFMFF